MKRLILISIGVLLPLIHQAQVDPDAYGFYNEAILFSRANPSGTSRILGLGGTQIALGADISTIYSNPAGLGLFNRSVFSISPQIPTSNIRTDYLSNINNRNQTKFNIANMGLVINKLKEDPDNEFLGGSIGISLTRVDDFNSVFSYGGTNNTSSIIESWIEQSDGATTEQFSGDDIKSLAYFNYLIGPQTAYDPDGDPALYFTDVLIPESSNQETPVQEETVENSGSQYQWSFAYGGNFNDQFYFGLSLGLTSFNYRQEKTYTETFIQAADTIPLAATDLTLDETLQIRGNGINGTFGVIARPIDILRIGASVNTPTYYYVEDTYEASLSTFWNNFYYEDRVNGDTLLNGEIYSETPYFVSNYSVSTPWRFNAGAAVFLGKSGFITADAEFVNYGKTKLSASNFSMEGDNQTISNIYKNAINLRLGAEFRVNKFQVRGGYSLYGNSYKVEGIGDNISTFTLGAGLRLKEFFADLVYFHSLSDATYTPYILNDGTNPVADLRNKRNGIQFTLGFSF